MSVELKKQGGLSKRKKKSFTADPDRIRFEKAYKAFGRKHRELARTAFLEEHGLAEQTFYEKLSGGMRVLPKEADWMERFEPQFQPVI